jgi:hypothetical protein
MNVHQEPYLSGATAQKLTLDGLKANFRRRRDTNCSLGLNTFQMDVPFGYQLDFTRYLISLTGYTIVWDSSSNVVTISW